MMSGIRSEKTRPELAVRSALHQQGFRFSRTMKLPGRPDAILPKWKVAVFVHGCFWHVHGCRLSKLPTSNADFWRAKLAGNCARDELVRQKLLADGWRVATVWECATRGAAALSTLHATMADLGEWIRSRPQEKTIDIPGLPDKKE